MYNALGQSSTNGFNPINILSEAGQNAWKTAQSAGQGIFGLGQQTVQQAIDAAQGAAVAGQQALTPGLNTNQGFFGLGPRTGQQATDTVHGTVEAGKQASNSGSKAAQQVAPTN